MGVKGLQHPFDRSIDQVLRIRLLHILLLKEPEDIGEDLQVLIDIGGEG